MTALLAARATRSRLSIVTPIKWRVLLVDHFEIKSQPAQNFDFVRCGYFLTQVPRSNFPTRPVSGTILVLD
jgi:hypothetical protein